MPTIAKLTKQEDGSYTGTLTTLTLHAPEVTFKPEKGGKDNSPDYRIFAGKVEIGAGWRKTSRKGKAFVSVKLDDPAFAQSVYAVLLKVEDTNSYLLEWNRPNPRRSAKADSAESDF